jgi:hypothetical protein
MIIYIAGPYRGTDSWAVERNIRRAEEVAFEVARAGHTPLCPHSMFRFFDKTLTDERWLAITLELLRVCEAMVLVRGWLASSGTAAEVDEAKRLGITTYTESVRRQLCGPDGLWLFPMNGSEVLP